MREIKFDVILWESGDKESIEHYTFEEAIGEDFIAFKDGAAIPQDDSIIIREYTGLKDKQGREIYEGDIVKGGYSNNGIIKYGNGLVDASDYEAYAIPIHGFYIDNGNIDSQRVSDWPTGTPYSLAECHEDIEVIGNIYENPELLKERNSV